MRFSWWIVGGTVLAIAATSAAVYARRQVPAGRAGAMAVAARTTTLPGLAPSPLGLGEVDDIQEALTLLVTLVRPAVATVTRRGEGVDVSPQSGMRFVDPYADAGRRVGTGVFVDARGLLLTSVQVAAAATDFLVTWSNPREITAHAVRLASAPASDLVLLQVQGVGPFPAISLGDSDRVKVGDLVLAFGSPFGFASTTTLGIVGSNRRRLGIEGREFEDLIQTDTRLNPGDSGGPLVNIAGELIGINIGTLAMNSTFVGIGFAIASNRARELLARL